MFWILIIDWFDEGVNRFLLWTNDFFGCVLQRMQCMISEKPEDENGL